MPYTSMLNFLSDEDEFGFADEDQGRSKLLWSGQANFNKLILISINYNNLRLFHVWRLIQMYFVSIIATDYNRQVKNTVHI